MCPIQKSTNDQLLPTIENMQQHLLVEYNKICHQLTFYTFRLAELCMLDHIYTVKKSLRTRPLYIWGTGQKSMWIVLRFALRGVRVTGFIATVPRFAHETILGLPVIDPCELSNIDDAVIIADDYMWEPALEQMRTYGDHLLYSDCLEMDDSLSDKPIYIYGTGQKAWSFIKEIEGHGITVRGFLSSFDEGYTSILGKPVYIFDEHEIEDDAVIVVASIYVSQILANIESSGFRGDVYIRELNSYEDLMSVNTFSMLAEAVWDKKQIHICYDGPMAKELLLRCLSIYDIEHDEEVTLYGDPGHGIPDIYSLADKNVENSVLLFHSFSAAERCRMVRAAISLGFREGHNSYSSLSKDVYNELQTNGSLQYEKDFRMGVSIDYSSVGGLAGWAKHGSESEDALRIMALGGSTSSELYLPENWVSRLHKALSSKGFKNVIFNGAYEMDDAQKELSRMCRDIRNLAPDVVISMSGVNDIGNKNDKFDFLRDEDTFEYWKRIQRYMKTVAESENAVFLSFLQPSNIAMPDASLRESLFFLRDAETTGGSFEQGNTDNDFYTNLFRLFRHKKGKFIDFCHYSDEGHEEIAQIVCSSVIDILR